MEIKNNGANGEDNSGASPAAPEENKGEENKGEGTPSPEENKDQAENKPKPFHEDPAVQDYLNRQWSAREATLRQEIKAEIEQQFGKMTKKESEGEEIPEWFGGDLNQWKSFLTFQEKTVEKAKVSAVEEFKKDQQTHTQKIQDANDWFASSINTIETLTGKKIDQNALLTFTLENNGTDNKYVDKSGRWDYVKAFNDMQKAANKGDNKGNQDRKVLADGTIKEGGNTEGEKKTYKTSEDFKKERPW